MPASVIRTLDLCVYEARVLATHTRYFSLLLRYTLQILIASVLRYFMSIIRYY